MVKGHSGLARAPTSNSCKSRLMVDTVLGEGIRKGAGKDDLIE